MARQLLRDWTLDDTKPRELIGEAAEYLCSNGRVFGHYPVDSAQLAYLYELGLGQRQAHYANAHANCQHFIMRASHVHKSLDQRLMYCEGIAIQDARYPIPAHHAWLVLDHKHVIDLTWLDQTTVGMVPEGREYFGTEFPINSIADHWIEVGVAGELLPRMVARTRTTITTPTRIPPEG